MCSAERTAAFQVPIIIFYFLWRLTILLIVLWMKRWDKLFRAQSFLCCSQAIRGVRHLVSTHIGTHIGMPLRVNLTLWWWNRSDGRWWRFQTATHRSSQQYGETTLFLPTYRSHTYPRHRAQPDFPLALFIILTFLWVLADLSSSPSSRWVQAGNQDKARWHDSSILAARCYWPYQASRIMAI